MLDNDGLGERKPAELGVRDREAAGFQNDFPSVAVVLRACPPTGERPRGEFGPLGVALPALGEFRGEKQPLPFSADRPLGARPERVPWLLTDLSLESLERYEFPPDDRDLETFLGTFQPRILFGLPR